MYIEGDAGLNLQQILRVGIAASIQGVGKIWMPMDGKSNFVFEGRAPAKSGATAAMLGS